MPRWASRILLEITEVRVERLQEISEADAIAEGITVKAVQVGHLFPSDYRSGTVRYGFAQTWDFINRKKYPWSMNPWVWVLGLRRVNA